MKKNNLIIILNIFLILTNLNASSYEDFKNNIKKREEIKNAPKEILDYRKSKIDIIERRLRGLELSKPGFKEDNEEKINKIKECVNNGMTKQEIKNCIPSILREY